MADRKGADDVVGGGSNDASFSSRSEFVAEEPFRAYVDETKLLRKTDLHVVPILFLVYLAAFLDRVNISNALTMGLPAELGLEGQQSNIALCIFFVPYIIFEVPSNVLMKKLNPHIWLSGCILCFGIIMLCQGFVKSYSGLLATRFFLGLAEAGIFPGSFYLISFWYTKEEAQKRFTVYWSSTILAGAFGGLLASAIANMNHMRGLSSWRWVFILEGIATVLISVLAFFCITDFPREAKWLSPEERAFLLNKTKTDESRLVPVTPRDVLAFLRTPKAWLGGLMYLSVLVTSYSLSYFTPTIIQTLGYSTIQTQLHSVPPFAAAFGLAVVLAYLSDKARIRSPFIFLGLALLITGLSILITTHGSAHFSAEYAGVCLTAMGSFGIGGMIICWYVMNLRGHVERSIGTAWMIGFGNCGGIVATFLFVKKDAPYYHTGYTVCLSMGCLCIASCACYAFYIWRQRKAEVGIGKEGDGIDRELYL
ncbi:MFS general substrate transporter [Annulohypoxylon maeteangense]|uniref:MFS general substrate transporter n=1 Tax=Annulohypoxylon maeteangense TaxID=1927788 RepID=UPI0020075463|nr:MFS general substrate transporter [Annulohypoxylon maeteangense]KAI0890590.1 MFS general substrate transporter [Annulohypoxylon maeteangense]